MVAQVREPGMRKFVREDATHSKRNGRFRLTVRPRIGEIVRLRSGSVHGPVLHVRVRPRVVLRRRGPSLVAKVRAGRSYAGRTVVLQVRRHGQLGRRAASRAATATRAPASGRPSTTSSSGSRSRRTPGYLPAHSDAREAAVSGEIFVVGASRSGTNLVRALLNAHSRLWISAETHYFDDLRPRLPGNGTEPLAGEDA